MASEPIECQVFVLRVSIHCEGCKKKVKKVLQSVHGVLRCDIDARSNKVVVTASTKLDPSILVAKLRKSGKQADMWPEPPQPPAENQQQQGEETKKQNDEQSKPAEKSGPDKAEAAEPSNPQPSQESKQSSAGEPSKPAPTPESKEESDAGDEDTAAAGQHQQQEPNEPKGKAKQQPEERERQRQPVDARVTMEYDRGVDNGYTHRMPAPQPIMSYNMARPSQSASYYAAPPAPAPMPMARAPPGPSHGGYIDEHYTPSYYGRPYEQQPYYYPPQPSPYSYPYHQPTASSEDYYYSARPQRSAFSPPRDEYGEMFNDENANSCTVM